MNKRFALLLERSKNLSAVGLLPSRLLRLPGSGRRATSLPEGGFVRADQIRRMLIIIFNNFVRFRQSLFAHIGQILLELIDRKTDAFIVEKGFVAYRQDRVFIGYVI